jgi:xylulose-5-phosphate/fructose-6-phosphate phosphoketolase
MTVLNQLDRYHLALEAIERVPELKEKVPHVIEMLKGKLALHTAHVQEYGEDMPEIRDWKWTGLTA